MIGKNYQFILLMFVGIIGFFSVQDVFAVTVYPGTHISNPYTNYTADVYPNFNVTQVITNSSHIFLGNSFYDLSRTGSAVNANITGFYEDKNATFHITNSNTFPITLNILGHVQQVKLDGVYYPPGSIWNYNGGTNETSISVSTHTLVFISWSSGSVNVNKLYLSGAIFGATAYFNPMKILLTSPPTANVSEIGLFNSNGLLYDKIFSPAISITAGTNYTIPYKFNDSNTGLQTYTAEAVVNSGANSTIATSNSVTIYFGSFTPGQLTLNYTNSVTAPFTFTRTNVNSTYTNLDVYYPSSFNSTCKLNFNLGLSNKTYYNLPTSHATFHFVGSNNDVIDVNCFNENGNETGNYVLTQNATAMPIVQQIKDFRAGQHGTLGMFGAFDLVTLLGLILSIIGFNRVNEALGAIFNTALIGALAYFGIIQWPVVLSAGVALVLVLVVSSTKKLPGF